MPNIGRPTSTNQPVPSMTSGMQSGNQHSMASQGNPQNQQAPSQGQSDPSAMLSPAGGPMQMAFPAMMPQQQPQYQIMVNQQGQQVLMPVGGFAGQMAVMPSQGAQPTNTGTYVIMPKGAGQQPQMIGTPTAAATQTPQGQAGGAKYTLTSTGIVPNAASAAPQNIIFQSMGGSPTVQPANSGMMPNTSHPSHVKTEAGKQQQHQLQSNQTATSAGGQQTQQQMTAAPPQPQMILPPGMTFVNPAQTMTGQPQATAYMGQNGQIYMAVNKAQDAGQAASQLVFSTPQGLQMQPHPQALQPNLNQPMPPGLNTSMTPMAMTSTAASSGNNMVRTTFTTNQHAPTGKTQISRAPPTLLPATTSSMITTTSRPTTTTTSFLPSPKSKQKMSPKGPPPHNKTNLPPKNILNTIKNNSNTSNSVSPPVLTTSNGSPITIGPPGSPFSVGPPVLQTSLAIPPPMSTAHSQPPTLHPMNSPMMIPTSVQGNIGGQYYNMSKSSPMAPSSLTNIGSLKPTESAAMTSTPKPIIPANNKKAPGNIRGEATIAAPMEQVGKPMTTTTAEVNGKSEVKSLTKTPTEILTHVIDGNVIQESSQPFPVDATEGRNRKKSDSKSSTTTGAPMTNTSGGTTTTSSLLVRPTAPIIPNNNPVNSKNDSNERKRGPGRPPGSTKQNIEQQRQLQQQHQSLQQQIQPLQGGDLVKHKDGVLSQPMNKKAKVDFETGPPPNLTSTPQHQHQQQQQPGHNPTVTGNSATSPKLNIDMGQGNPLKWDVKQVCDFVKNLPGCSDYVEDFQLQEIDGQALMLLKAEHLMQAMAMKLGPALKIYNAITALHEQQKQN